MTIKDGFLARGLRGVVGEQVVFGNRRTLDATAGWIVQGGPDARGGL